MNRPEIKLRPETDADELFLRKLYATTRVDVTFSGLPDEEKQQFIRMQFDAQRLHYRSHYDNAAFYILELNGDRVGRMYVARLEKDLRLIDLTLSPEYRNRGIGSDMIRALQSEARSQGLPLTLHAEKLGQMAVWYERFGFEIVEEKEAHFFMIWTGHSSVILA